MEYQNWNTQYDNSSTNLYRKCLNVPFFDSLTYNIIQRNTNIQNYLLTSDRWGAGKDTLAYLLHTFITFHLLAPNLGFRTEPLASPLVPPLQSPNQVITGEMGTSRAASSERLRSLLLRCKTRSRSSRYRDQLSFFVLLASRLVNCSAFPNTGESGAVS